jgi:hypothetical protein
MFSAGSTRISLGLHRSVRCRFSANGFWHFCCAGGEQEAQEARLGRRVGLDCRSARSVRASGIQVATLEGLAVLPNRSFDTDAQVLPCAARTRLVCAGQVRRYRSKMKEVVAHALAPCMTLRLPVAFESGWRHGRRSSWALALHAGGHRSGGMQSLSAPARHAAQQALKPQHFSGGPSRAFGGAALQRRVAPATAKDGCRALGGVASASCRLAVRVGLALARAASDNKSMHTDVQVLAALRLRFPAAGDFQRYRSET